MITIKDIRRMMREGKKDHSIGAAILIPGYGQVKRIGNTYAVGPLPEDDDSDIMTDYSAWSYGWKEKWVLDDIRKHTDIQ